MAKDQNGNIIQSANDLKRQQREADRQQNQQARDQKQRGQGWQQRQQPTPPNRAIGGNGWGQNLPKGGKYTVKSGDSWESIAGQFGGDQRKFYNLMRRNGYNPGSWDKNKNFIPGDVLQAGTVINIPQGFNRKWSTDPYVSDYAMNAAAMTADQYGWQQGPGPQGQQAQPLYNPQQSYWNDPQKVAAAYQFITSQGAGFQAPEGLDVAGITAAYKMFEDANKGLPSSEWKPLDPGNPLNASLNFAPPPGANPSEMQVLSGPNGLPQGSAQQVDPSQDFNFSTLDDATKQSIFSAPGFDISKFTPAVRQQMLADPSFNWDNLPRWQKWWYDLSSNGTAMGAATGLFFGGGPVGALVGAGIGAVAGATGYDQSKPFTQQTNIFAGILGLMNLGAETVERTVGFTGQVAASIQDPSKYGNIDEIIKDPKSAWEAARVTYENTPGAANVMEFVDQFLKALDAENKGADSIWDASRLIPAVFYAKQVYDAIQNGEYAGAGEDFILGRRDPIEIAKTRGLFGIDAIQVTDADLILANYRRQIASGRSPLDVMQEAQQTVGGQVGDLVLQGIFDPLNVMGEAQSKAGELAAKAAGNEPLAHAFETSKGLREGLQQYGAYVRADKSIADITNFDRIVAGLDKTNAIKELAPIAGKQTPWQWLTTLTPQSRAMLFTGMTFENITTALNNMEPEEFMKAYGLWSNGDNAAVRDMGAAIFDTPEMYTALPAIKGADVKMADAFMQYETLAPNRETLGSMANLLGETPGEIVKAAKDGVTWEQQFTRMVERAKAATGDVEAAQFLRSVEQGTMTPDVLQAALKVFTDTDAPYTTEMWKAQTAGILMNHAEDWIKTAYQLQPDSPVLRMFQVMKSVQSIVLLGLSPTYVINNTINNALMTTIHGIGGTMSADAAHAYLDEMGMVPARLNAVGLTGESLGVQAGGALGAAQASINDAMSAKDFIASAQRAVSAVNDKVGIFANLSIQMEKMQGSNALVSAIKQSWPRTWREGIGYRLMPAELERGLSAAGINARDVYAVINGTMNTSDLVAKAERVINRGEAVRINVSGMLDGVAQSLGSSPQDAAELLGKMGMTEYLDKALESARTPQEIDLVFQRATAQAQDWLAWKSAQDLKPLVEHWKNKIKVEGVTAISDILIDSKIKLQDVWDRHGERLTDVFSRRGKIDPKQWNAEYQRARLESTREWQRVANYESAGYMAIVDAVGIDDPKTAEFLGILADNQKNRRDFFRARDSAWDDYAKNGGQYDAVQASLNGLYRTMIDADLSNQAKFDKLFTDVIGAKFGADGMAKASSVFGQARDIYRERAAFMIDFRERVKEMSAGKRKKAWAEFWKKDNASFVNRMVALQSDGYREIFNGKAGEAGPGTPPPPVSPIPVAPSEGAQPSLLTKEVMTAVKNNDAQAAAKYADVWKAAGEIGMPGADAQGNQISGARLDLIKFVKKYGDEAGRYVKTFDDITPEIIRTAQENKIARERLQTTLPTPAETVARSGEQIINQLSGPDRRVPAYEQLRQHWETLSAPEQSQVLDWLMNKTVVDKTTGLETLVSKSMEAAGKPAGWIDGMSDLNGMKAINDTFGHPMGDKVLAGMGQVIKSEVEAVGGRAFRVGGDEISYWFPDQAAADRAFQAIDKQFKQAIITLEDANGKQTEYSGFTISYGSGENTAAADAALYADKNRRIGSGERAERGTLPGSISSSGEQAPGVGAGDSGDTLPAAGQEVTPAAPQTESPYEKALYNVQTKALKDIDPLLRDHVKQQISEMQTEMSEQGKPMFARIIEFGGLRTKEAADAVGERNPFGKKGIPVGLFQKNGLAIDIMLRYLEDEHYFPPDTDLTVFQDALRREAGGDPTYSPSVSKSLTLKDKRAMLVINRLLEGQDNASFGMKATPGEQAIKAEAFRRVLMFWDETIDTVSDDVNYPNLDNVTEISDTLDKVQSIIGSVEDYYKDARPEAWAQLETTLEKAHTNLVDALHKQAASEEYRRASTNIAQAENSASTYMDRQQVRTSLVDVFRATEDEADAAIAVLDARADTWGKATGATSADWYKEHIAGIVEGGDGALNFTAYHGSPYKFDKFSLDHLGRGEGAQAYGWGLYFADDRSVAEWYRKTLTDRHGGKNVTYKGSDINQYLGTGDPLYMQIKAIAENIGHGTDPKQAIRGEQLTALEFVDEARLSLANPESVIRESTRRKGLSYTFRPELPSELMGRLDTLRVIQDPDHPGNWIIGFNEGEKIVMAPRNFSSKFSAENYLQGVKNYENNLEWIVRGSDDRDHTYFTKELAIEFVKLDSEEAITKFTKQASDIGKINPDDFKMSKGQLYAVDLPNENYLLWDRPLDEQPDAVKIALDNISIKPHWETDSFGNGKYPAYSFRDDRGFSVGKWIIELSNDDPIRKDYAVVQSATQPFDARGNVLEYFHTLDEAKAYSEKLYKESLTGRDLYHQLRGNTRDKEASLALLSVGINGIKYLDGASRKDGKGTYNYVVFNDQAVKVIETYYKQDAEGTRRAAISFLDDGRAVIHALETQNSLVEFMHETGHLFRRDLYDTATRTADEAMLNDIATVEDWAGVEKNYGEPVWTREAEEKFAKGFEQYLAEGNAPSAALMRVFSKLKDWMLNVYNKITGSPIDVGLTDEMRKVFDRLLSDEPMQQAETQTSLLPTEPQPTDTGLAGGMLPGMQQATGMMFDIQNGGQRTKMDAPNARSIFDVIAGKTATDTAGETLKPGDVVTFNGERYNVKGVNLAGEIITQDGKRLTPSKVTRAAAQGDMFTPPPSVTESAPVYFDARPIDVIIAEAKKRGSYGYKEGWSQPTLEAWAAAVEDTRTNRVPRSVLGNALVSEFKANAGVRLVGQKITSSADLAALAQVYRNPKYETMHYFFTNGDEIVGQVGVSSRMPGASSIFPFEDMGNESGIEYLKGVMFNFDADGYYLQHNHPSGESGPSPADLTMTRWVSENLPGFKGHVIINHQEFTVINPAIEHVTYKDFAQSDTYDVTDPAQYTKPHPTLGMRISGPRDLASVAATIQNNPQMIVVLTMGRFNDIKGIMEVDPASITNDLKGYATIRKFQKDTGGMSAALVNVPANMRNSVMTAIEKEIILDAYIAGENQSVREAGAYPKESILLKGREVTETTANYDDIPAGPGIAGLDPEGKLPPNSYDQLAGWFPEGTAWNELFTEQVQPLLDGLKDRAKERPTFKANNLDPATAAQLDQYLKKVKGDMPTAKLQTMRWAEIQRDNAMLNYSRKFGADQVANIIFPYQFWYTRSMANWAWKVLDRPAIFSNYYRLRTQMSRYQKDLPERLRGKIKIPMPFLPEWAGDSVYVDVMSPLFPFTNFSRPLDIMMREQGYQANNATYILKEWATSGEITQDEMQQATANKQGPVWERAFAEAGLRADNQISSPFDFASAMFGPAWYLSTPLNLAGVEVPGISTGKPGDVGQLPITRLGASMQTATEGTPLDWLGKAAGMMAAPEKYAREKLGIGEYGGFTDYYIDRQLANMAADGNYSIKDIQQAMIERSGPLFDEARKRVDIEQMTHTPGASLLYGAAHGQAPTAASAVTLALGGSILSDGELKYMGLKEKWNAAWTKYNAGDKEAINQFFSDHPEYQARLALRDTPEERLRQFLVTEVWDRYMSMDKTDRRMVAPQLGADFEAMFLNKETRSYESIPPETLAKWAKVLGGTVPRTSETAPVIDMPEPLVPKLIGLPAEIKAGVTSFYTERDQQFKNIATLQDMYYSIPETQKASRRAFARKFPELSQYWDWKSAYIKLHPDVEPFISQTAAQKIAAGEQDYPYMSGATFTQTMQYYWNSTQNEPTYVQQQPNYFDELSPITQRQVVAYRHGLSKPTPGAMLEIRRIWEAAGKPTATPDEFLRDYLMQP